MHVHISIESKRGCGYRSPGAGGVGFYLMGEGKLEFCERLPFPLHVCPVCSQGIKPARGYTWIEPQRLFADDAEPCCTAKVDPDLLYYRDEDHDHATCYMCNPSYAATRLGTKAGLIWIGEKHYPFPSDFMSEAARMGISRKIGSIPDGFNVGYTVIYLAHRKAVAQGNEWVPGVFSVYRPTRLDLVIDDPDNVPDKAINIAEQLGEERCRIVKVIPDNASETESLGFEDF